MPRAISKVEIMINRSGMPMSVNSSSVEPLWWFLRLRISVSHSHLGGSGQGQLTGQTRKGNQLGCLVGDRHLRGRGSAIRGLGGGECGGGHDQRQRSTRGETLQIGDRRHFSQCLGAGNRTVAGGG